MKKRLVFFAFFLGISPILFGQNYPMLKSTIVDLNGNTKEGYVEYQDWLISPEHIYFSESIDGQKNSGNVGEINSFDITAEGLHRKFIALRNIYISYIGANDDLNSVVASTTYEFGHEFETEHINMFAEVVFESEGLQLIQLIDKYEKSRLFLSVDGVINELKSYRYMTYSDVAASSKYEVRNTEYKKTLEKVLGADFFSQKTQLDYAVRPITALLTKYAKEKGQAINEDLQKAKVKFSGLFGVGLGRLSFEEQDLELGDKSYTDRALLASASVGARLNIPGDFYNKSIDFYLSFQPQIERLSYRLQYNQYFGGNSLVKPKFVFGFENNLKIYGGLGVSWKRQLALEAFYMPKAGYDIFQKVSLFQTNLVYTIGNNN
ncbi:hypothetical protein [Jiulongibacter sediminis]|uniref:hypothetical protein n=1 Tax=Jiulongibacter sediminis TaxID=1605367 RepID=UPI0026EAD1B7|nr:hypothetical protein [Jiulongibacter sediminis]